MQGTAFVGTDPAMPRDLSELSASICMQRSSCPAKVIQSERSDVVDVMAARFPLFTAIPVSDVDIASVIS
jgi:hypothetical protein